MCISFSSVGTPGGPRPRGVRRLWSYITGLGGVMLFFGKLLTQGVFGWLRERLSGGKVREA